MGVTQKQEVLKLIKKVCARVQERNGYVNKTKLIKYLYLIDVEYYRNMNIHLQDLIGYFMISGHGLTNIMIFSMN